MSAHSAPQSSRSNEQPEDAGRIQSDHAGHHTPAADDRPVSGGAAGSTLHRIAGPMLIGLGLAGMLSLMLPIAKALGESVGWFDYDETSTEGTMLMVSFAVVIVAGIVVMIVRRTVARIIAGVVAVLIGVLAALDGFGNAATIEDVLGGFGSAGSGLYVLGIVGLLLVVAGIMLFIPGKTGDSRRRAATTERVS